MLVITTIPANYKKHRVLVDSGRSADILFLKVLKKEKRI